MSPTMPLSPGMHHSPCQKPEAKIKPEAKQKPEAKKNRKQKDHSQRHGFQIAKGVVLLLLLFPILSCARVKYEAHCIR